MGMSEVVMLDMKGHMVVLGTALHPTLSCWMQTIHLNAYPDPAPKKWVGPDPENHIGSTPLVPQDSGMTK